MSEYSLSDIAAVSDGGSFGGNSWTGLLFLFALIFGFNGNCWGGNRSGNCVTEADLCTSQNFNNLQNAVGRISDQQAAIARQTDNAICQIGYQNLEQSAALGSKIDDCCCTTQRAVDSVKFDMANYAAATNVAIMENTQKVLDKLCAQENAALQARVNQLELQQALCGVPRINPYGYGVYPTFGNCGCANGAY